MQVLALWEMRHAPAAAPQRARGSPLEMAIARRAMAANGSSESGTSWWLEDA